jgi:hypothetical protein
MRFASRKTCSSGHCCNCRGSPSRMPPPPAKHSRPWPPQRPSRTPWPAAARAASCSSGAPSAATAAGTLPAPATGMKDLVREGGRGWSNMHAARGYWQHTPQPRVHTAGWSPDSLRAAHEIRGASAQAPQSQHSRSSGTACTTASSSGSWDGSRCQGLTCFRLEVASTRPHALRWCPNAATMCHHSITLSALHASSDVTMARRSPLTWHTNLRATPQGSASPHPPTTSFDRRTGESQHIRLTHAHNTCQHVLLVMQQQVSIQWGISLVTGRVAQAT